LLTDPSNSTSDSPAAAKPSVVKTQRFRSFQHGPRLSADAAVRQGRIAQLAWSSFGDRDLAISFLNEHQDALGGRPLDLAVASEAGYEAVENAIGTRTAHR
jgi:uncharacterized protein (DUF2384 family)